MPDALRVSYSVIKNARGDVAVRPQLPFVLSHGEKVVNSTGLLDTGADVNVMPYEVGTELGVIWSEQTTAIELSGNLARYEARGIIVSVTIGQFAPVRLAFAWTQATNVPLILGQVNFFMKFDVCFYRSRNFFEVRPKG